MKKIGVFEIELYKDCFGIYLCRAWIAFDYIEVSNKNKFTAVRTALKLARQSLVLY